jgi:hypothetical protein
MIISPGEHTHKNHTPVLTRNRRVRAVEARVLEDHQPYVCECRATQIMAPARVTLPWQATMPPRA